MCVHGEDFAAFIRARLDGEEFDCYNEWCVGYLGCEGRKVYKRYKVFWTPRATSQSRRLWTRLGTLALRLRGLCLRMAAPIIYDKKKTKYNYTLNEGKYSKSEVTALHSLRSRWRLEVYRARRQCASQKTECYHEAMSKATKCSLKRKLSSTHKLLPQALSLHPHFLTPLWPP